MTMHEVLAARAAARQRQLMIRAFQELFRKTWDLLAQHGQCDERGGAEYRRVYGEWCNAGCPRGIVRFIRRRANIQANGQEPSDSSGLLS